MTKKTRKDCFFGMHFDFHADVDSKGIGLQNTAEDVARYLDAAKPEFLNYDTKGHPGYTSYFTKYGNAAPGLEADFLKVVREETQKRGIRLYAHHSGIFDVLASRRHPEWTIQDNEGNPSNVMDVTGPYADELLIKQLKELCLEYGFDGVWVDGENWAYRENYRYEFLEKFYQQSGYPAIDPDPYSPSHLAFREYCRDKFVKYIRHYIAEIKKDCPDFEISSNCAYGHFMPEKPMEEMDYLTEDGAPAAGGVSYLARCFTRSGKPWDVQSWGALNFDDRLAASVKIKKALHFEAREGSQVISQGGSYMASNTLNMNGKMLVEDEIERMRSLSEYLHARKPYNWGSIPLENTVVYLSDYNKLRTTPGLYDNTYLPKYACQLVLNGGRPVDVIFDYHILEDRLGDTKTIILPEIQYLSKELISKLRDFAEKGGNLILCGTDSCRLFEDMAGATFAYDTVERLYVQSGDHQYGIRRPVTLFEKDTAIDLCNCYSDLMDSTRPTVSSVILNSYGKGKAVFIGWNIISEYKEYHNFVLRNIMRLVLDTVEPTPYAYLEKGLHRVEIVPAMKEDKMIVNVINTTEIDDPQEGYDEIVPLHDLVIAVRYDHAPSSVKLQPEGISPAYTYDGTYLHVTIDKLEIHSIIVVE